MCVCIFCVFYIFYFVCACVLDVLNNSTFLTVSYSHIVRRLVTCFPPKNRTFSEQTFLFCVSN